MSKHKKIKPLVKNTANGKFRIMLYKDRIEIHAHNKCLCSWKDYVDAIAGVVKCELDDVVAAIEEIKEENNGNICFDLFSTTNRCSYYRFTIDGEREIRTKTSLLEMLSKQFYL